MIKENINPIIMGDLLTISRANLPWDQLDKKTILITGGSGFLAGYLIQSLLVIKLLYGLDIRIVCVARNINTARARFQAWNQEQNFEIFGHDISQPLPKDFPLADFIIHAASQASPKYYGVDPVGTLMANSVGTKYLLDHALASKSQKFLYFSSGEIYGIPIDDENLVTEESFGCLDPMEVRSCYAESKRMGETMCVSWSKQYDLHTVVVRPFHTYGPGMSFSDGRVFADFVANVVEGKNIVLKSDGMARRPFCYLTDATIGFLTVLLLGKKANAYNVGNPNAEIAIKDLALRLSKLMPGRHVEVVFQVQDGKYMQSPIARSCPDIGKLKALGWMPTVGVDEGFSRSIESFLNLGKYQ